MRNVKKECGVYKARGTEFYKGFEVQSRIQRAINRRYDISGHSNTFLRRNRADTKKEIPQRPSGGDSDNEEVREDEEPAIVVLKKGDITPEEYEEMSKKSKTGINALN